MNQCVDEMISSSVAETRHPIREVCVSEKLLIRQVKSGKWKAEIQKAKVKHKLGTYATIEDAREALNRKKCELGWEDNAEQTEKDYDSKRCELGLQADAEQPQKNQRPRGVYRRESGRWQTEIRHPVTKARICLGTFDTAEEAKEAKDSKRREFDSLFPGHEKRNQTKRSCDLEADPEQSQKIRRLRCAEEAYDSKRCEFDSACVSDDPSVSCGLSVSTEEAKETYDNDLGLKAEAEPSQKNQRLRNTYPTKSGRWQTEIRHPITKARSRLGTFATAEEAKEAYDSKRREFDLMFPDHKKRNQTKADTEQSQKNQRLCHVYATKSGRWTTEIGHPITKVKSRLGTFDTAEEAKEAYDSKRREFALMFPDHKKRKQTKVSGKLGLKADAEQSQKNRRLRYVYPTGSGRWRTEIGHPITKARVRLGSFDTPEEAKEACDSKLREFDLLFPHHKKRLKQSNDSCRDDSACVSGDPSASSGGSMLNANVESVPMSVTEGRGEFDSDVIDSYGQLVGEYNRLDDELWLCRPEDDATLQQDDGYEW